MTRDSLRMRLKGGAVYRIQDMPLEQPRDGGGSTIVVTPEHMRILKGEPPQPSVAQMSNPNPGRR